MLPIAPRHYIVHFLISAVCLLLIACGGSPEPAPIATIAAAPLPADWQSIDLQHLALALPPQWERLDAEDIDLGSAIGDMAAQNPQLQALINQGQAALASGEVQLIAYDLQPDHLDESGFPANIRIGRQSYPQPPSAGQVADVNEQDLRKTPGFSEVTRAAITIGGTPATRLTSTLQINDAAGQPLKLALEQYLLISGNDLYVLTFTTPSAKQQSYRPTFDQILATLRFK